MTDQKHVWIFRGWEVRQAEVVRERNSRDSTPYRLFDVVYRDGDGQERRATLLDENVFATEQEALQKLEDTLVISIENDESEVRALKNKIARYSQKLVRVQRRLGKALPDGGTQPVEDPDGGTHGR